MLPTAPIVRIHQEGCSHSGDLMSLRTQPTPWIRVGEDGTLKIVVNTAIYPVEVLFRTCYTFTDRCYLFLEPDEEKNCVYIHISGKELSADVGAVAGEFANELINQELRRQIAAETRSIRELIVTQAFAEADFQARSDAEADYQEDPKGIAP